VNVGVFREQKQYNHNWDEVHPVRARHDVVKVF